MIIKGEPSSFNEYRAKISLLGPEENFKSSFLDRIVMQRLPESNKSIIGVTMGSLRIESPIFSQRHPKIIQISIWDIDCSAHFSILRGQYYRGSGVILVILDENTLDQAMNYFSEIQQQDPTTSMGLVILYEGDDPGRISNHLNDPAFQHFSRVYLQEPQQIILWGLEMLGGKMNASPVQEQGGILFLPKVSLLGADSPAPHYLKYTRANEYVAEAEGIQPLNILGLERFATRLGIPVRDLTSVVTNKFGEFHVSLQDGAVRFTPRRCIRCKERCKQQQDICIVAGSKGFSSNTKIKQAEMLVVAKILALHDGAIPKQVIRQISRRRKCPPIDRL